MAEPPIDLLKALAHPLRYAILAALAESERNVGEIEGATGIGQPTLSQHLSVLRGAGLVETRREARLVYYRNAAPALAEALRALSTLMPETHTLAANPQGSLTGAAVFARMV